MKPMWMLFCFVFWIFHADFFLYFIETWCYIAWISLKLSMKPRINLNFWTFSLYFHVAYFFLIVHRLFHLFWSSILTLPPPKSAEITAESHISSDCSVQGACWALLQVTFFSPCTFVWVWGNSWEGVIWFALATSCLVIRMRYKLRSEKATTIKIKSATVNHREQLCSDLHLLRKTNKSP